MYKEVLKRDNMVDILHMTQVSEATGEVTEWTQPIFTEEKLIKDGEIKKHILSQDELHQYIVSNIGYFFFYFYNKLDDLNIQPQYKLRFLYLASYLDFDGEDLIGRGQYNIKMKLNRQNLKDILLLKEAEFKNTVKILVENGLLIKDDKYYKLNTDCSVKGTLPKNSKSYTRVFITSIRKLYSNCEAKKHKQLYYLFKILPTINLQFNISCENTEEDILSNIKPLSMNQICELIGYDNTHKARIWNELRKFKVGEEYLLCKHTIDDIEALVINPRLFYAGTRLGDLKYTQEIFDMVKKIKSHAIL